MDKLLHVLFVEDCEDDAELLVRYLKKRGFKLTWDRVESAPQMKDALQRKPWDIVISDYAMPLFDGLAALRVLQETNLGLPFIIVSGTIGEETAVEVMKAGADDYILKGNLTRLGAAIERGLQDAQVRRERKQLQIQLAQADRMASVGMLAAGVVHEINNPLTYVIYNIESLVRELGAATRATARLRSAIGDELGKDKCDELVEQCGLARLQQRFENMQASARDADFGAERIRHIVRDLKMFSHIEEDVKVRVNLNEVIESAINMASNEIKYRAQLNRDFGNIPPVLASEGRLSQVFLNLLVNAAQAIDEGDVHGNSVSVRTWSDQGEVFAEVSDTGKGIPPGDLERLFDPFFTTKPAGVGSGLGLSICHNIVSAYDGEIGVSSDLGQGSRFTTRFPQAPQDEQRQAISQVPVVSPVEQTVTGTVLVVDDDVLIRRTLERVLGGTHDVHAVKSGSAAKELLSGGALFDVILCDVMMPHMSGVDLYEWVKQQNPQLAGQIVFITGGIFTPRAIEFFSQVENPQIEKPFDWDQLHTLVNAMVESG